MTHEDYTQEAKRLEETKEYIERILAASEGKQESFKDNIKEAFVNLDHLDSSLSYINILINAKFFEMSSSELQHLRQVRAKPYFARIDFQSVDAPAPTPFYIGKVSLFKKDSQEPIIVDWRSPLASLYYDSRLGNVTYTTENETFTGDLSLKRQYTIEDGVLEDIRDIDITTRDELLQASLSTSADNRLTEIVSTIQAEQNDVIRSDLSKPVIVQGAAGSGKTTIALHRLSMFIYAYADTVKPEEIMILAPNRLFIDYISEALPELGVQDIKQMTFLEYVQKCLKKQIRIQHPDDKLKELIAHEDTALLEWASTYKGSLRFKQLIEHYVQGIAAQWKTQEDFKIEGFTLYKAKKVNRLLFKEYKYLPLQKRLKKVRGVLLENFKKKKKELIAIIERKFEERFDELYYSATNTEEKRKRVVQLNEQKDRKITAIKNTTSKVVTGYMKQFELKKAHQYYQDLITNERLLAMYSQNDETEEQRAYLAEEATKRMKRNKYEWEDLAPLLYLQHLIYGIEEGWKAKNVVIDEAQDYSLFQFYALKAATGTDLFTILGDLSQGIHSYRGLQNWDELRNNIFSRGSYRTLQKSYRTTIEIMHLANALLKQTTPEVDAAEPVVRHGPLPVFHSSHASGSEGL